MKKLITLLLLTAGFLLNAQIKGKITDKEGHGIPFVSVSIENTYNNTTANENGGYELPVKQPGKYTVVFQSIGFKTKKVTVNAQSLPHLQNVTLDDDNYELKEVVVNSGDNPANEIIRQAIAHKKENSEKLGRFEADFYSKGIFRVGNLPKKLMGMKIEGPEGLDKNGNGVIYLSETVSHLTFEQPNKLKERVIATKVSGSDNGFSYGTALTTFYNFYDDYVDFEVKMVSPLAKGAFGYYKYKFEGSTFDEQGHEINKIKIIPRRDKEPVFEGYIYIVSGSWAIYAVDVDIKGYRVQMPPLKSLKLQQNFSHNTSNGLWAKNSQTFDFEAGMFGINFTGKFTHVYSNYVFHDKFDKKTFGREVVSYEKDAIKKDSTYWTANRPVPLTDEETKDYIKKDSLRKVRENPARLDSIAKKHSRFGVLSVISGHSWNGTRRDSTNTKNIITSRFTYNGFEIPMYNTVQGWNTENGFSYSKYGGKLPFTASVTANYGLAEDRFRFRGAFSPYIRKVGTFHFTGGNSIVQFNPNEPISPLVNTISSLVFKNNYMKLYDKTFMGVSYSKTLFDRLSLTGGVEYSRRKALFNNTDYVLIKNTDDYFSNNPLNPLDNTSVPFATHYVTKATVDGQFIWPYDYMSTPYGGKVKLSDDNLPTLGFHYEKIFAANKEQYKYDFVSVSSTYRTSFDNKGNFGIAVNAGKFFGADGISFADYKHFNGNQTHYTTMDSRLKSFNLLPYYTASTNNSYLELHAEHDFNGYIMNKIPLLNLLQWNLIVGYHGLMTPDTKPYHEFTAGFGNIGLGAFRILRVDYVHSFQGNVATNGVMFSLAL
ncbi:DUF5686 and carboxypeptidase regulatory-like domain-containing protein [Flavobacterium sp. RNTU_13]|uniref:DUF5686 and carboxypeptidase regulatory-like domain-containing protein n=1 Tax=Flavobacterium sp. RNTU_13 TaxID=3375145 RepID=UPI0039884FB7